MSGVVVVGGSVAGVRAVQSLRRFGYQDEITLVEAETESPYDKPPLSKEFLGSGAGPRALLEETEWKRLSVTRHLGTEASGLDADSRSVCTALGPLKYSDLVIATGSAPRQLPQLSGLRNVHVLRSKQDARALRAQLRPQSKVVIVGAGFVGTEVASTATAIGARVTLLEASEAMMSRSLHPYSAALVADIHRAHEVDVRFAARVTGSDCVDRFVRSVYLEDGSEVACDVVLVAIGAVPTVGWLEGSSGLTINDGVACDATLAAFGVKHVWAVGDVARWPNQRYGRSARLEHWTAAREQAVVAAENIALGRERHCVIVPYVWSDQFNTRIQYVGTQLPGDVEVLRHDLPDGGVVDLYVLDDHVVAALGFNAPAVISRIRLALRTEDVEYANAMLMLR